SGVYSQGKAPDKSDWAPLAAPSVPPLGAPLGAPLDAAKRRDREGSGWPPGRRRGTPVQGQTPPGHVHLPPGHLHCVASVQQDGTGFVTQYFGSSGPSMVRTLRCEGRRGREPTEATHLPLVSGSSGPQTPASFGLLHAWPVPYTRLSAYVP